jgi:hypothetical protein
VLDCANAALSEIVDFGEFADGRRGLLSTVVGIVEAVVGDAVDWRSYRRNGRSALARDP